MYIWGRKLGWYIVGHSGTCLMRKFLNFPMLAYYSTIMTQNTPTQVFSKRKVSNPPCKCSIQYDIAYPVNLGCGVQCMYVALPVPFGVNRPTLNIYTLILHLDLRYHVGFRRHWIFVSAQCGKMTFDYLHYFMGHSRLCSTRTYSNFPISSWVCLFCILTSILTVQNKNWI